MPSRPIGVEDVATGTGVVEVDGVERASPDLTTTTTADPGSGGTTLAVTSAANFPAVNNYKIRVEAEVMLVTAGAGTTSWTVTRGQDNTTAVAHGVGVKVAMAVWVQRFENVSASRQVSYMGMVASFRTPGRAATAQNLFSIFNASGSAILIAVRRLTVQVDDTAALLAVAPIVKVSRSTALPTNGSALTKVPFDTSLSSSASVTLIGDASADGTGSGTTLTSTPDAAKGWAQYAAKHQTLVGQAVYPDATVIPTLCENNPIILRAAQGLLVHVIAAATTSNPVTKHYVTNCVWEEFTSA